MALKMGWTSDAYYICWIQLEPGTYEVRIRLNFDPCAEVPFTQLHNYSTHTLPRKHTFTLDACRPIMDTNVGVPTDQHERCGIAVTQPFPASQYTADADWLAAR